MGMLYCLPRVAAVEHKRKRSHEILDCSHPENLQQFGLDFQAVASELALGKTQSGSDGL